MARADGVTVGPSPEGGSSRARLETATPANGGSNDPRYLACDAAGGAAATRGAAFFTYLSNQVTIS